uniref:C-type lectin domain-containing protein n=1 Tax=Anabas testudineus TaxID=64144 RepID=A0A3Q1J0I9_ANATE
MSSSEKSWQESRNDCLQKGTDLVIINSSGEQDFIRGWKKRTWIGLTDKQTEGTWRWVDGTVLTTPSVTRAKTEYYQDKLSNTTDTRKLFSTFKSLLYPPPPSPPTCLTPDDFASFFTNNVAAITSQFAPPDNDFCLLNPTIHLTLHFQHCQRTMFPPSSFQITRPPALWIRSPLLFSSSSYCTNTNTSYYTDHQHLFHNRHLSHLVQAGLHYSTVEEAFP